MRNVVILPSPDATTHAPSDPLGQWLYEIRPSKPLPVVDLSRTPARSLLSDRAHEAVVQFMRSKAGYLEHYRMTVVTFLGLLFVDHGVLYTALLVIHPCMTVSIFVGLAFLSLDLLGLLLRSYDFWFMSVFIFFHWSALALVMRDTRVVGCVIGYLSTLQANVVDANLRGARTMIQTGVLGILLYVALTLLVAWQCIAGQKPFDLVINGRRQGDAGDGLAFTTSTISVFLIKLAVVKRIRAAEKSMPGLVTVPCATIKSVLRLVPKATASSIDPSPPENLSLPRHRLRLREENQTMIDGRNTILPQKYWRWLLLHHRYFLCISLRVLGAFGFLFMWAQGLMNFRRMKAISLGKSVVPVTRPSLVAVFAVFFTSVHCGVYVLFYQRDLFRDLITRFDFLFTSVQLFTFSICMCDTQGWDSNSFSVLLTFLIWLHWTLTLDALTPNMKRLLGFFKRHATHVSASALFSCIGLLGVLFFTQTNPLRDRVLWSYPVSSTYTIKLRVQTILLGRIVTILLWCSRQTALLLVRKEDELQSIYGALHYDNPYESFPAPHKHAKRRVNVQFVGKEAQDRRIN